MVWLRFDLWLIVVTIAYSALVFGRIGFVFSLTSGGWGNPLADLLGLFVPVGPNNFFLLIAAVFQIFGSKAGSLASGDALRAVIAVGIVIFALFFGERFLRRYDLSPGHKSIANIAGLFVTTCAVDLLTTGNLTSILILLHSMGIL
jgi:hypothetical protein